MKQFLQISALLLTSLAFGTLAANADVSGLALTCGDANAKASPYENGHCTEGMVTFRGSSYPENIYVRVLSYPEGRLIDQGGYSAHEGLLEFTQTLVPAGAYTVTVARDEDLSVVYTNMTVYTDSLSH